MNRGYEKMSADEILTERERLSEKRRKTGLSCTESGKLDFCNNVIRDVRHYSKKSGNSLK